MGGSDELRQRRVSYNAAIAAQDADAIAAHLTDDYEVTTSTGEVRMGRDASRHAWRARFLVDPSVVFVRTPDDIAVDGDTATETGTWTGSYALSCSLQELGGDYTAEWRRIDGEWYVAREAFHHRDA